MATFIDLKNRTWHISLTLGAIKRVKELCDVNLLEIVEPKSDLADRLQSYPPLLCDLLYAVCKPEMDAANVSDIEFGESLNGDTLAAGLEALIAEVINFSPKGRKTLLKEVYEKQKEVAALGESMALDRLNNPAVMEQLKRKMAAEMDAAMAASGIDCASS
jgi:hypothetical protein